MKSNTLPRGDWGPLQISSRTSEGEGVNKVSISLRLLMREVQNLAKTNQLDWIFLGHEIQVCSEYLNRRNIDQLQKKVNEIAEILNERSLISSLLRLPDKESFETLSKTFKKYSQLMAKFKRFSKNSQERIINDFKRDLSALKMYVDQSSPGSNRLDRPDTKKYVPMISFGNMRLVKHESWRTQSSTHTQKDSKLQQYSIPWKRNTNQLEQYVVTR